MNISHCNDFIQEFQQSKIINEMLESLFSLDIIHLSNLVFIFYSLCEECFQFSNSDIMHIAEYFCFYITDLNLHKENVQRYITSNELCITILNYSISGLSLCIELINSSLFLIENNLQLYIALFQILGLELNQISLVEAELNKINMFYPYCLRLIIKLLQYSNDFGCEKIFEGNSDDVACEEAKNNRKILCCLCSNKDHEVKRLAMMCLMKVKFNKESDFLEFFNGIYKDFIVNHASNLMCFDEFGNFMMWLFYNCNQDVKNFMTKEDNGKRIIEILIEMLESTNGRNVSSALYMLNHSLEDPSIFNLFCNDFSVQNSVEKLFYSHNAIISDYAKDFINKYFPSDSQSNALNKMSPEKVFSFL